jgi:hypothetical protein
MIGQPGYPNYSGDNSMGDVHKFMDLNPMQLGYFITQVGLSAASFGVTMDDVTTVGMALNSLFGYRCSAPAMVIPNTPPETQAICQDKSCPLAPNANCSAYGNAVAPTSVNATNPTSSATSPNSTGSSKPSKASMSMAISFFATLLAAVAFALMM